jgi:NodT family efflux transporter outer membrane factor (OMF) lipoprotein
MRRSTVGAVYDRALCDVKTRGHRLRPKLWVLFTLIVFFSGCKVGPKYRVPAAPIPTAFKEAPPAGWKEAQPQDGELRGNWWELFGDAALNVLEEQVNISNQNVVAAEAQFQAARAAVRAQRAGLFPTVTIGANATQSRIAARSGNVGGITTGPGSFFTIPIDFTYEVDAWGRVRRSVESAIATAQASAAEIETVRLSAHAELALDYFALRGLDEEKRLLDENVAAFERALELTTNRYNQGIASGLDVSQARTQLENTRAELIDLGSQRAAFEHGIAILIGRPPADLTIAYAPGIGEPPVIPTGLPSELLERRPDIATAERTVASANAQIGVAKAALYPSLTLNAAAGVESSAIGSLLSLSNRFWTIGPSLLQTVFDAGRRSALIAQAEAQYDVTAAQYRETILTAFRDVEDNLAALRILAEEARQYDVAIESAQRSVELSTNRYRGGVASYLEVIVAQAALLTNQRTAVNVQTRRISAAVLLVKALGGGWNASQLPSGDSLKKK